MWNVNRGYCYGEGNCYLILNKTTCIKFGKYYWNVGKWEKCQIKGINNCLQLSKDHFAKNSKEDILYNFAKINFWGFFWGL